MHPLADGGKEFAEDALAFGMEEEGVFNGRMAGAIRDFDRQDRLIAGGQFIRALVAAPLEAGDREGIVPFRQHLEGRFVFDRIVPAQFTVFGSIL